MNDELLIVKFRADCGRMGRVHGLFVCTRTEYNFLQGEEVYLGEVLGKHSEITVYLEEGETLFIMTKDQDFINKFIDIFGDGTVSGINPLDYCEYDELLEEEELEDLEEEEDCDNLDVFDDEDDEEDEEDDEDD